MGHQERLYLFIAALIGVAIIAIYLWYRKTISDRKKIAELKIKYELELKKKDKQAALSAGRNYYRALRGGELSIYDEQAIANDLSTI